MERIPHTSRIALLASTLLILVSGCGKPWVYHIEHYDGPFDVIAQSNKTYFHSPKTGKIIPKEECREYCEPGCYGFEPTTWTHWPTQCPGKFPVQGEVMVEPVNDAESFYYPQEVVHESVIREHGDSSELGPELAVPPPMRQMPVDPTDGLEDPIVVPEDALPDATQPPASPSITIPSDLESSSPSPSDAADSSIIPELPEAPVRLAPPSTKIPVGDADAASSVKDPTVQLVAPIRVKARLIQANGYEPMSLPTQDGLANEQTGQPTESNDSAMEEPLFVAKRSITAALESLPETSALATSNSEDTASDELAVRKLVRTQDNEVVLTVVTNEGLGQHAGSPIPALFRRNSESVGSQASSKLHQIRLAQENEEHVGWQVPMPTAPLLSSALSQAAQVAEAFPVRAASHTALRDSTPDQQALAAGRLQEIQQTSGEASTESSKQPSNQSVRRAVLSDDLFGTDELAAPKKLRIDPSVVAPPELLPSLRRMTPAGLPLAKKVMPKKQPKAEAPTAAPVIKVPTATPERDPEALATKPAATVAGSELDAKSKRATSMMSKQIVVGQPANRPKTTVPKVILKPELTPTPKGIVTDNPLAARSLAATSSSGKLRGPIPHSEVPFDVTTQGNALGNQLSQPILPTQSHRLAKPGTGSAGTLADNQASDKSMLGFSSAPTTRDQMSPPAAQEKPTAVVSVTVTDEGSGMLQFAKDPPKREVRISSLPESAPSIRFR